MDDESKRDGVNWFCSSNWQSTRLLTEELVVQIHSEPFFIINQMAFGRFTQSYVLLCSQRDYKYPLIKQTIQSQQIGTELFPIIL